jgi:polysaccharide chain length determinant protein (PEP-CTERM system associated)
MLGHREMTLDDYLDILRRRFWVILLPTLILPVLSYGVSLVLPEEYTSSTLVLVEQPKVPETIVRSVVNDQLNERLGTMQQRILSRSRLQPIMERLGLYKDEIGKVPMEDLVGRMRSKIKVSLVRSISARQGEVPGFTISFTADNARMAQQVCQELTSMFIDENLKIREQRAQGTTDFLQRQLDDAKRVLDEKDKQLAEFKRQYLGSLPGQEQSNMAILMGLTTQLEATTSALNRAQQDKAFTQAQLDQALAAWKASLSGTNPQTLDQQLAAAQANLAALEARYTADHPDVMKEKRNIEQIKRMIEEANARVSAGAPDAKTASAAAMEPPSIQQMRSQIHQYDVAIKDNTRKQEQLQEQIKIYRSRVEVSPLVEQKFKELTRDYQGAQEMYDDLLRKRGVASIGKELEEEQQSEQFRVMDPANLPAKPSFPNRLMFAAGGLGGGLGLGLGIALLLEMRDKSIRTERDVEAFLQLPTLALVPSVAPGAQKSSLFSVFRKKSSNPRPAEV